MPFPEPTAGLVVRYSYLWHNEHVRGQEEGVKDRPCAVIMTTVEADGSRVVTVLPVTHTPPADMNLALEIPLVTKQRLGLDSEHSWVILSEANRFAWPGPDLRPMRQGDAQSVAYGQLPYAFFEQVRLRFISLLKARRARVVPRTE